ncbi:integrase arm-type DNA-binding domain-containing protein [Escherichia marmotae]|nr:integrase arm-type DNA-binding domain-containing protein [Escherichia marmotae]MED0604888.1 integrase arm-type DNA-binding domain-containing protein [Escherichia marmotae]
MPISEAFRQKILAISLYASIHWQGYRNQSGSYPELSLTDARIKHQKYLSLLAKGIDPKDLEREAKTQVKMTEESRFSVVAKKWHDVKKEYVSEKHAAQIWSSLERDVFPALGNLSVAEIKAPTLITALKPVEVRGALETLSRLIQRINEIMEFAVNLGLIEANPLSRVGQVFKKPQAEHMPTIRPERIPELTRRIETTNLGLLTRYLIKWQLLTLTRPVEAAEAEALAKKPDAVRVTH